ncbi:MAG: ATP-binding protein, partial [Bacteroidota bacterium]
MKKKELIKELIVSFQQSLRHDLFSRDVDIPFNTGKIVVLKGVRRSGKSSTLHLTIHQVLASGVSENQILFINFDDERIPFDTSEFDLILQSYRELFPDVPLQEVYMFFDEIQVTNGWEQFVRRVYDNETCNIFITGSNARLLGSEIATSLRGRTLQYEIFPLSFGEYCQFNGITGNKYNASYKARAMKAFHQYLFNGGFPELVINSYEHQNRILQEYYHVMLYRDLLERYEIRNLPALKYFIRRILANITKPTSINKIFNEMKSVGISVGKNSLYEWIDYLEAVYLFFPLPAFEPSMVKESAAEKKYYCIDNGLQRSLSALHSDNKGALLENIVYLWLRNSSTMETRLYYYKGKKECDFVVAEGGKVDILIQVSWDVSDKDTLKREIAGLLEASEKLSCSNLWLITTDA